ncbi:MAG: hypothetical protein LLG04_10790 [Parachlamydia sp.]|nr:hypothetical protein [Parachlamydia sp.]
MPDVTKRTAEALNPETTMIFKNPLTDAPLGTRKAKEIEKRTNITAQTGFEEGQKDVPVKKKIRTGNAEAMLEDYKVTQLSLREMMFLLVQIQTLLAVEHERIIGPHLHDMADRSKDQSEKLAEEQRTKKVSIPQAVGGALSLAGAMLMALKLTGTALPGILGTMIPPMLQVAEQGANPLVAGGQMVSTFGQINQSISQAEQTKLQHIYKWTEERLREIDRVRNQVSQEKQKDMQKLEQLLNELHRFVSEMLSTRG